MKTTCPHCTQHISIDPETLSELQGQEHFSCPACGGLVSVPSLSGAMPVAILKTDADTAPIQPGPPPYPANTLAQTHRGLNRNLLILGSAALLVLGGIGFSLASRRSGDTRTDITNVNNEIIHNTYFQNLIASGATTVEELRTCEMIRPCGDGFLGISGERVPWPQADGVAVRVGARVLDPGNVDSVERQELSGWLKGNDAEELEAPVWVQQAGQARVLDGDQVLLVTGLQRKRHVLLRWGASRNGAARVAPRVEDGPKNLLVNGDFSAPPFLGPGQSEFRSGQMRMIMMEPATPTYASHIAGIPGWTYALPGPGKSSDHGLVRTPAFGDDSAPQIAFINNWGRMMSQTTIPATAGTKVTARIEFGTLGSNSDGGRAGTFFLVAGEADPANPDQFSKRSIVLAKVVVGNQAFHLVLLDQTVAERTMLPLTLTYVFAKDDPALGLPLTAAFRTEGSAVGQTYWRNASLACEPVANQ